MKVRIQPSLLEAQGPRALLRPPPSKSDAHRALVLGHLLRVPVVLGAASHLPNDVRVLSQGLESLQRAETEEAEIDVEDAGAPFRILLSLAATRPGARTRFTGTPRLAERPHTPLLSALRASLGEQAVPEKVSWPLPVLGSSLKETAFPIDPAQSSQFVTGLLLAAAQILLQQGKRAEIQLLRPSASQGYLDITLRWLERAGLRVTQEQNRLWLTQSAPPPSRFQVPGDWSSLSYLLLLSWKQRRPVQRVPEDPHPDARLLEVLRGVGLSLEPAGEEQVVTGVARRGFDLDISTCPDLAPTLAALSLVLPEPSYLRQVEILRGKESDRVEGVRSICRSFGGEAELLGQDLRLLPGKSSAQERLFHPAGDHRLAMAAAVASVLTSSPLVVQQAECVAKSFPGFWEELGVASSEGERPLFG